MYYKAKPERRLKHDIKSANLIINSNPQYVFYAFFSYNSWSPGISHVKWSSWVNFNSLCPFLVRFFFWLSRKFSLWLLLILLQRMFLDVKCGSEQQLWLHELSSPSQDILGPGAFNGVWANHVEYVPQEATFPLDSTSQVKDEGGCQMGFRNSVSPANHPCMF